ncbi:Undecaprenyl-phosphate glucose phosphotransferase [Methylophilaceae bacterium 11]|nr:Undecaprenyl-phosphate glucose phosphotransferase [Methylophilaceae bacterium 11]
MQNDFLSPTTNPTFTLLSLMNAHNTNPPVHKTTTITIARENTIHIVEAFLDPLVTVFTLWAIAIYLEGTLPPSYLILSIIVFSVSYPGHSKIQRTSWQIVKNTLVSWSLFALLFLGFGQMTHSINLFPYEAIVLCIFLTPVLQLMANFGLRTFAPALIKLQGPAKRAIIAGMNEQGLALADRLMQSEYEAIELKGFFEDRSVDRIPSQSQYAILGKLSELGGYAKDHDINIIYLSLPMASQPRVLNLLDDLKDTTASIYFVPDIFLTDLVQSRVSEVDGIPVVAVCESPFMGFSGITKRLADLIFSIIILIPALPLLLLIAIGIKLSSPGPVIFKQRRYGLDGKEIIIYKFRSMSVCEDGNAISQAQKDDARTTPFGAFLRKTSLDELPQLINVLQGRMSVVGPRPHAVAHNEMYRKLIKGYMIRHKVKPGITGWAQVNGLRGETETLNKMQSRIDYDLEYLRHWSMRFDLHIIFKTIWVILFNRQKNVY